MQLKDLFVGILVFGVITPAHAGVYDGLSPVRATVQNSDPEPEPESTSEIQLEAKTAFERGSQAYALGNYEEAVASFERSYQLSSRPELLFNLGQAYAKWYDMSQDVAHLRKAKQLFENYIVFLDSRESADGEARADARRRIEAVDRQIEAHLKPDVVTPRRDRRRAGAIAGGVVAGVVVVTGAILLGVLLSRSKPEDPELGTIGGVGVRGPGVRF